MRAVPSPHTRALTALGLSAMQALRSCSLSSSALLALLQLWPALAHTYTYQHGALPAGNDAIPPAIMTLADAEAQCNSLPACVGFTFKSPDKAPRKAVKMYFKDAFTIVSVDPSFQTYLRDYIPPPPPPTPGAGKLFMPKLFADNMVLQRAPARANIWGWGAPQETVTVTIAGQSAVTTAAAANGTWSVDLAPQPATPSGAEAATLNVSATSGFFSFSNVVYGDVYVCGGQSNMAFATSQANNATAIIADSVNYPRLRLFTVKNPGGNALAVDVNVSTNYTWGVASPATVGGPAFGWFSAVCFLYGRDLYTSLKGDVPIGLVSSNVGGTFIQLWSSGDALAACSSESKTGSLLQASTPAESAPAAAAPALPEAFQVNGATNMLAGGALWNTMIVPLLPMAVRGAIFYQGEANLGDPLGYACQQRALITDWQAKFGWHSPGFHFSFVELAPGPGPQVAKQRTFLTSYLRTSQLASLDIPNVSYASAADKGDPFSPNGWWHPRYKQPVRVLPVLRQPNTSPFKRASP